MGSSLVEMVFQTTTRKTSPGVEVMMVTEIREKAAIEEEGIEGVMVGIGLKMIFVPAYLSFVERTVIVSVAVEAHGEKIKTKDLYSTKRAGGFPRKREPS
ncbi:MAG: hypothetical protein ACE5FZ_04285 [Nitrospiria bacterium]